MLSLNGPFPEDMRVFVDDIACPMHSREDLNDADLKNLSSIHASEWKGKRHWPALEDGVTELLHTPRPC